MSFIIGLKVRQKQVHVLKGGFYQFYSSNISPSFTIGLKVRQRRVGTCLKPKVASDEECTNRGLDDKGKRHSAGCTCEEKNHTKTCECVSERNTVTMDECF